MEPGFQLYRTMKMANGKPIVGDTAYELGVRYLLPGQKAQGSIDVHVDEAGLVHPGEGMSATAAEPRDLPSHRRPQWLDDGNAKPGRELFVISRQHIPDTLGVIQRGDKPRHYQVEPRQPMPLPDYREDLASTQDDWKLIPDLIALDLHMGKAA